MIKSMKDYTLPRYTEAALEACHSRIRGKVTFTGVVSVILNYDVTNEGKS